MDEEALMEMLQHPMVLLWLTISIYWLANTLRARTGSVWFNPVLLSTVSLIVYLKVLGISYERYHEAAQFIDFWLKPAVVGLALPLYLNWDKIR